VSELKSIFFAPLFHHLDNVLDLRIVNTLKHLDHILKSLFGFFTSYNHLENSNRCSSFTFPELWIGVKTLKDIESFSWVVELAHLIAVIGNEVQESQALVAGLHVDVDLPSEVWLEIHNVAFAEPRDVDIILFHLLVCNLE